MNVFNKNKPLPKWVFKKSRNKNLLSRQRRVKKLYRAQPNWADCKAIRKIYRKCRSLNLHTGMIYNVDHIIPLSHPLVCGLHVHYNLQIIPEKENQYKGNRFFPGQPYEQFDLFFNFYAPINFELKG